VLTWIIGVLRGVNLGRSLLALAGLARVPERGDAHGPHRPQHRLADGGRRAVLAAIETAGLSARPLS